MAYEPKHTLSEILKRRRRTLERHIKKLGENPADRDNDEIVACTEEIASIEYHLRIVEDAERSERTSDILEVIKDITISYDKAIRLRQ